MPARSGEQSQKSLAQRGTQTVTEGTDVIVRTAAIGPEDPAGSLVSRDGRVPG
jgi:hypothetical protein